MYSWTSSWTIAAMPSGVAGMVLLSVLSRTTKLILWTCVGEARQSDLLLGCADILGGPDRDSSGRERVRYVSSCASDSNFGATRRGWRRTRPGRRPACASMRRRTEAGEGVFGGADDGELVPGACSERSPEPESSTRSATILVA